MPLDPVLRDHPKLCAFLALLPMMVLWAIARLLYTDHGVPGSLALFAAIFASAVWLLACAHWAIEAQ
ncbi:hypothetical protein CALVIDRAFT_541546 [Calocera viscosa TUFC12733]|uniref:Uncharacterized protein n=1 Tax=Calocera viscosa (strain TUFC12733) TaxID=1330018 RepID=A0A167HN03_CALVF|nr:hypothetical protein CALVIDRAFT_541546 [Calocera viscosa TUFC12733]